MRQLLHLQPREALIRITVTIQPSKSKERKALQSLGTAVAQQARGRMDRCVLTVTTNVQDTT